MPSNSTHSSAAEVTPPPERHARVTLHAERHAGVTLGAEGGQAKVSLRSGSGPNLKCRPVIPVGITRT